MATVAPVKLTAKDFKSDLHNDWCPACVAGDTRIVTFEGAKPIVDVKVGELVLGHDGKFHPVIQTMAHWHDAAVHRLTVKCFGDIVLTPDHPVYVVRRERLKRVNVQYEAQWVEAKDVRFGDYVAYPVQEQVFDPRALPIPYTKKAKDTRSRPLPKTLAVNDDFLRLAGYYISEGHKHDRELVFTFGGHEMTLAEDTVALVAKVAELPATINAREGKNSIDVRVSSSYLADIFAGMFGTGAVQKRVPEELMLLSPSKQAALLRGLWAGDGTRDAKRASFRTISPVLAEQVKFLLLRQGIVPTVTVEEAHENHRRAFKIEVLSVRDYNTLIGILGTGLARTKYGTKPPMIIRDGYAFLPVRKNEVIPFAGMVYNLEVEGANSYVTTAATLHNCGDFGILSALQMAFVQLQLDPDRVAVFSGIGCSGKTPHYLKTYGFHTLHGRVLTVATGGRLANSGVTVVALGGDGDGYGIGAGYFVNTGRRNLDFAYIVHNNGVYGLTKGQASPTLAIEKKTKSMPEKAIQDSVNPIALAIASGYTWVGRGYALDPKGLAKLIAQAIEHEGSAILDVLQTCPTYNDLYTKEWYDGADLPDKRSRLYELAATGYDPVVHDASDLQEVVQKKTQAVAKSYEVEPIPIGVYYKIDLPTYEERLGERMPSFAARPLAEDEDLFRRDVTPLLEEMR